MPSQCRPPVIEDRASLLCLELVGKYSLNTRYRQVLNRTGQRIGLVPKSRRHGGKTGGDVISGAAKIGNSRREIRQSAQLDKYSERVVAGDAASKRPTRGRWQGRTQMYLRMYLDGAEIGAGQQAIRVFPEPSPHTLPMIGDGVKGLMIRWAKGMLRGQRRGCRLRLALGCLRGAGQAGRRALRRVWGS